MSQMHVPGYEELLDDAQRTLKLVLAASTVEQRLDGLSPEALLHNLGPAAQARLRELVLEQDGRK